jgi:hypothetical protein
MRALLINGYYQVMKEIVLPAEAALFHQQVKQYLNSEKVDSIHPDKLITILFDPLAFTQAGIPAFLLGLLEEFPFWGNVICIGRNPVTFQVEDLPEEFTHDHFKVSWYDPIASEECRKKTMQIGIDNYRS